MNVTVLELVLQMDNVKEVRKVKKLAKTMTAMNACRTNTMLMKIKMTMVLLNARLLANVMGKELVIYLLTCVKELQELVMIV